MKQETESSILIIMAGFFWGLVGLFTRSISACGLDAIQITFVRMLVSSVLFAAYLLVFDKSKFRIQLKDIWMFAGTGLFSIFLHNITFFYAAVKGESSVASVLVNTSPIFIMFASAILFKERITKRKILALVFTFTGCVFVSGVLAESKIVKPVIALVGIMSGFFYGMYTIFSRYALKKYSSFTVNMYTYLFALLGGIMTVNIPDTLHTMFASSHNLVVCIETGTIPCLIPFLLYTKGLEHVENSKAAILVALDPIVATLTGILFLNENSSFLKLLGIALIITSIVILNTGKKK